MNEEKRAPYLRFFAQDWMGDSALRACSLGAHGLWINMICIMHNIGQPYGHLSVQVGQPLPMDVLCRMVGCAAKEAKRLLDELEGARVFSRTELGVIYSRKLVRMNRLSITRSKTGSMGGNPDILVKQIDQKELNQSTNQSPPTLDNTNGTGTGNGNGSPYPDRVYQHVQAAEDILKHLNTITGAQFRLTHWSMTAICERLCEIGGDVAGVKTMLCRQNELWRGDPKMARFLRPTTLFDSEKFPEYFAQRNLPIGGPSLTPAARQARLRDIDRRLREIDAAQDEASLSERRKLRVERDQLEPKTPSRCTLNTDC